nr:MAG TPA: hypothetical protein [Caudoviricetes sp.]
MHLHQPLILFITINSNPRTGAADMWILELHLSLVASRFHFGRKQQESSVTVMVDSEHS